MLAACKFWQPAGCILYVNGHKANTSLSIQAAFAWFGTFITSLRSRKYKLKRFCKWQIGGEMGEALERYEQQRPGKVRYVCNCRQERIHLNWSPISAMSLEPMSIVVKSSDMPRFCPRFMKRCCFLAPSVRGA